MSFRPSPVPRLGSPPIYESRLNNGRLCLALFEKSGRGAQIRAKGLRDMADDAPIRVEMVREKIAIAQA